MKKFAVITLIFSIALFFIASGGNHDLFLVGVAIFFVSFIALGVTNIQYYKPLIKDHFSVICLLLMIFIGFNKINSRLSGAVSSAEFWDLGNASPMGIFFWIVLIALLMRRLIMTEHNDAVLSCDCDKSVRQREFEEKWHQRIAFGLAGSLSILFGLLAIFLASLDYAKKDYNPAVTATVAGVIFLVIGIKLVWHGIKLGLLHFGNSDTRKIAQFAEQTVIKSRQWGMVVVPESITIPFRKCQELADTLEKAVVAAQPHLASQNPHMLVFNNLHFACPRCGELDDHIRALLLMFSEGGLFNDLEPSQVQGGQSIASLQAMRCPCCNGTEVIATFNPGGLS